MSLYFAALVIIATPLFFIARRPLDTCAGLIILNWLLGFTFNWVFGTYTPWLWSLAIDLSCGVFMIMRRYGERWPVVVALPYIGMILCHFIYAYADGKWSQHGYWSALTWIAWAQMGLLTLYGGSHLVSHSAASPLRAIIGGSDNFNRESAEK